MRTKTVEILGLRVEEIAWINFKSAGIRDLMVCPVCSNARYKPNDEKTSEACPGEKTGMGEFTNCSNGQILGGTKGHSRCKGTGKIPCRVCHGRGSILPYDILIGKPSDGEWRGKTLAFAVCRKLTIGPLPSPIRFSEPSSNGSAKSCWTTAVGRYQIKEK